MYIMMLQGNVAVAIAEFIMLASVGTLEVANSA